MNDILHKELSYKVIGIAFEVFNTLGDGLSEKDYGNAFEEVLKSEKVKFVREIYYPIEIRGKVIGKKFFDFLIDDKIVVELKTGNRKYREACMQLFEYLKISKLDLGIVIRFTNDGVKYKRIPNIPGNSIYSID